jgi:hypothetical protein
MAAPLGELVFPPGALAQFTGAIALAPHILLIYLHEKRQNEFSFLIPDLTLSPVAVSTFCSDRPASLPGRDLTILHITVKCAIF